MENLGAALVGAARSAFRELFAARPDDHFYYCSMTTTGEGTPPSIVAWSWEALDEVCLKLNGSVTRENLKWSYADSPFLGFGAHHFTEAREILRRRPQPDYDDEEQWDGEIEVRLMAMEAAMAQLDAEGLFGKDVERSQLVVCVEIVPFDPSNRDRVLRLNSTEAAAAWLSQAPGNSDTDAVAMPGREAV